MKTPSHLRALSSFPFVAFRRSRVFATLAAIFAFPAQAILDTNNNGLSDLWEKQHNSGNLFPNTFLATNDEDQDGWTNAREAIAGTDPFQANPPDGIVAITITPSLVPGAFTLTWPTLVGKSYQLKVSTDLVTWSNLGGPISTYETTHSIGINTIQPDTTIPPKVFWRVVIGDLDTDSDGLTDSEEYLLGTNIYSNDSDWDELPDFWEIINGFDPIEYFIPDTDADPDNDGISNRYEYLLGLNPHLVESTATDRDNDGMPDLWEAKTALYMWTETGYAHIRQLDWDQSDSHLDFEKDGLLNINEYHLDTNPVYWDSDGDLLPDGWEVTHGLNAKSSTGDDGAAGDPDGDGLSNFDELANNTDPQKRDTDDDGATDKEEVDQGSDPNSATDGGNAPAAGKVLDVPFRIGDPSGSNSERWKLTIQGNGPDDTRKIDLSGTQFGEMYEKTIKLRKWNRYTITITHVATNKDDNQPDYDWEAQVDGWPTTEAVEESTEHGWNNYFCVKNHWLVDNRKALFTKEIQGNDTNLVAGKSAYLVPIEIGDNLIATGVDDVSVTADPASPGYQENFWIMAPQGGTNYNNDMYFKIPLVDPALLKFTCANATPTPDNVTLDATSWQTKAPVITWRGQGTTTTDNKPNFVIGPHDSPIDLPIRVKSMKKRTVKLSVFPVRHNSSGDTIELPDKASLEAWLNEVYGYQINAWFEVTYHPPQVYDYTPTGNNAIFKPNIIHMATTTTFNVPLDVPIRIFVIDALLYETTADVALGGLADPDSNMAAVVSRDTDDNQLSDQKINETIAHEIGHILIGEGHPDQNAGPAPLYGTNRSYRLMNSGYSRVPGAKLLVKKEWDLAEEWLKKALKE